MIPHSFLSIVRHYVADGFPVIPISDVLGAFYPDPNEDIRLRAFKPKGAPKGAIFSPEKIGVTRMRLARDMSLQSLLKKLNETRGLYFVVNAGGDKDENITRANAFFAEIDDLPIDEQLRIILNCPLPPSILIITRKSVHAYWLRAGDCTIEQWREIQGRLIGYFGSDPTIKNPSRVMRLPYFDHIHYVPETGELERKRVEMHLFEPSRRYTVEQMFDAFPAVEKDQQEQRHEEQENQKNKARFWTGFVCGDARAEDRRRSYGERALVTACNIIREAPNGQRFDARRRAGKLIGGYIAGGMVSYSEAYAALEDAVRGNTDSFADAIKVLKSAIEHGQTKPISFEEKEAERLAHIGQKKKKAILLPVLKPISKPQDTITLEPPKRPTDTIELPKPMRPAATAILTMEVASGEI